MGRSAASVPWADLGCVSRSPMVPGAAVDRIDRRRWHQDRHREPRSVALTRSGSTSVAMCVDDVVCTGAGRWPSSTTSPSASSIQPSAELVSGVAAGCRQAARPRWRGDGRAPRLMAADAFDLAGTAIGVVERSRVIDGSVVRVGMPSWASARPGCIRMAIRWSDRSRRVGARYWEPYQARLRRTLVGCDHRRRDGPIAAQTMATAWRGPADADTIYARPLLAFARARVPRLGPARARACHRRRAPGTSTCSAPVLAAGSIQHDG